MVSFILLLSCNNASEKKTEKLTFKAFKLIDDKNEPGPEMDNDGNIIFQQDTLGKINNTGEIFLKDGKHVATYSNDTLHVLGNKPFAIKIDKSGTVYEKGSITFSWDKTGSLLKEKETTGFKVSPHDPIIYKNASILFILYFSIGDVIINRETTSISKSDLNHIVENFKNSNEYLSALKTKSIANSTIALQSLFKKFRVLDFFSNLDDLNKNILSDYNNALDSIRGLSNKPTLDIKAGKKLITELKEITKGYKIQSSFSDKKTINAMDTLTNCIQTLFAL